jgi:hypothetical protein
MLRPPEVPDNQMIRWVGGTPPAHPALLARPQMRPRADRLPTQGLITVCVP